LRFPSCRIRLARRLVDVSDQLAGHALPGVGAGKAAQIFVTNYS
jgi:hypothetical protein